jgi:hypothetical protein
MVSGAAAKALATPGAGYVILFAAGVVTLIVFVEYVKAQLPKNPIPGALDSLSNFDQNVGLGGFDAWVSGLFSAPVQTP